MKGSGLFVEVVGVVDAKRSGVGDDGSRYYSATIAYMGGSQPVYCQSEDEWNAIPEEGTEVTLEAKGKILKDGKLRLSNVKVEANGTPAPTAARRAAPTS